MKTIILLSLIGSLVCAQLNPGEPAPSKEASNSAADTIPYYDIVRQLLYELAINEDIKSEDFMNAFNDKDYDATNKMLAILGSQIVDIGDKGLYCFLLGAYYKLETNKDKKFKEEVPIELFYLGALYCNDNNVTPYCDNLFKKNNLPKINAILKKKPPYYRIEKLELDYRQLRGLNQMQTSVYETCQIFPSLSICQFAGNATKNVNINDSLKGEKIKDGQKNASTEKSKNISSSREYNKPTSDPPSKYNTAEEKYDFLKDYDPHDKTERKNDENREITQEDILNDQKKRYEQLHEIIVKYFKTNAHERNIRADCYLINTYRSNPSDIGLKVRLTAYEDEDHCEMTNNRAEALTDCLIGALKRHESITGTKFEDVNTSITIHCPKSKINSTGIAEKFADIGIPIRSITQKNGDFSIEFNSPEYYNEELNKLNKKIQDYKKNYQKN